MAESGTIKRDIRDGYVTLSIDNLAARNALSDDVLRLLAEHIDDADRDPDVRAIVLAGQDKVFAAGADIRALSSRTMMDSFDGSRARDWDRIRGVRTPTVAAVSGYCFGGGAELAMMCDIIVAAPSAKFALPETMLGLLPGAGGTQMLPRAVGKALAMDMVLTGRVLTAAEALEYGLISRVSEPGQWLELAEEIATIIAGRSTVAQKLAKQAVRSSFDNPLTAGLAAESSAFGMAFASDDGREGIAAFIDKRDAIWTHA